MAGLSSRFSEAGYDRPKFMLPLGAETVFDRAVGSFSAYFSTVPFLFIARGSAEIAQFVTESCAALGIEHSTVQMLREPTAGQAETVELGLLGAGVATETPITIFNIDTFRPGFEFPDQSLLGSSAGFLEVFRGAGGNWSYVRAAADQSTRVVETAEKRPISDLCCTGLYHFARAGDFLAATAMERAHPSMHELYVAPLYNHLIGAGLTVHYRLVPASEIVFCGVPSEYEALRAQLPPSARTWSLQ
jgi:hypothetical protein